MKSSYLYSRQYYLQPLLLSYLLLILILFTASSSAKKFTKIPRLSPTDERLFLHDPETLSEISDSDDVETFFYNQTLDHFNYRPESYSTFRQRYFVISKYWGGRNSPILAYFGAEGPLDSNISNRIGFLTDNAPQFKALLVYIEVYVDV